VAGIDNSLIVVLIVAIIGPVILSYLSGRQRRKEKEQDYERQDAVATEAKRQQDEVADKAAEAAQLLSDRQDEIAKQAEGVAQLLLAAQQKTTKETAEVARLAATSDSVVGPVVLTITLAYPNGNRQEALLAEVPRIGEHIRLSNGADDPWLTVVHVLWVEGTQPPHVIVSVRPLINKRFGPQALTIPED
jgi:type II secretory pathway pseudopilin PulG